MADSTKDMREIEVDGNTIQIGLLCGLMERADDGVFELTEKGSTYLRSWMQKTLAGRSRHPLSERFHELLAEAGEMHDQKQLDYGKDDDPFANVRASSDWNMPAWVGAMVRATDKVRRLQSFARKGELANESAIDAFMDLAVYALIARVLYEEEVDGDE